jgi:cardiolipin synthase
MMNAPALPIFLTRTVRRPCVVAIRLWAVRLLAAGQLAVMASCASIPAFDSIDGATDAVHAPPRLSNAHGPLTARQSKAILDKLRRQTPDADILGRHLAFTEAIADSPMTVGNKVTLLRDGQASFRAIFRVIAGAKEHINLEYFTFEDVEQDGRQLVDLLIEKQTAGVQINIIYDAAGSSSTPPALFARLKQAGVNSLEFNPLNPLKSKKSYAPNSRDHRKILVVDGTTAIIGGVNISKVYSSNIFSSTSGAKDGAAVTARAPDFWRDTDVELEGPAVADLQRLFLATWERQRGDPLKPSAFFPEKASSGTQLVSVMGSTPDHDVPLYYITLLSAIRNAESRIWLTAAYFVPTHEEMRDLIAAARRGVDVRVMLPSHSDSAIALNIGRSHYADLLEAGVKVYEIREVILHSKTTVIDGVWSAVGSSNFDKRSVRFNDEVDAVILGRETGAQMETAFQDYIASSDAIDRKVWVRRPLPQKLKQTISRMWSYWL